jgi:hypothetical protein
VADALSSAEGAELADGRADGKATALADAEGAGNADGAVAARRGLVALGAPISAEAATPSRRPAPVIARWQAVRGPKERTRVLSAELGGFRKGRDLAA